VVAQSSRLVDPSHDDAFEEPGQHKPIVVDEMVNDVHPEEAALRSEDDASHKADDAENRDDRPTGIMKLIHNPAG